MKKLILPLIIMISLSSCIDEIINPEPDYILENYDLAILDELNVSDQFYENVSLVMEALDQTKSVDSADASGKYIDYLTAEGKTVDSDSQAGTNFLDFEAIYASNAHSDEFKAFATEFEKIIISMEGYNDFSSQTGKETDLMNSLNEISDANENQLANHILLSTDLLFQHQMQKALENGRLRINWQCVGTIGMGTLVGCGCCGPFGCVAGMGFSALSC